MTLGVATLTPSHNAVAAEPVAAVQAPAKRSILDTQIIESDIELRGNRAQSWKVDQAHHILLEKDVHIKIGGYGFRADRAVVVVTKRQLPGQVVNENAIYLDNVSELAAGSAVRQQAKRLLVTTTTRGKIRLSTDLHTSGPVQHDEFVDEADNRIKFHRLNLAQRMVRLSNIDDVTAVGAEGRRRRAQEFVRRRQMASMSPLAQQIDRESGAQPPAVVDARQLEPDESDPAKADAQRSPLRAPAAEGEVFLNAGQIVAQKNNDGGDHMVMLSDGLVIMYHDPKTKLSLNLKAESGVIFVDPSAGDSIGGSELDASAIRGIYLEDNVIASDGQYTIRGPKVFYDLAANRAIVLDAVMYTWDEKASIPIYVRADSLRQESKNQWSAVGAKLTTSEFFVPHFSIGMDRLTIAQQQTVSGTGYSFAAEGTSMNVGKVPVFKWPKLAGSAADVPLKSAGVTTNSRRGIVMSTDWDLLNLMNIDAPEGIDASMSIDGMTERGVGIGLDVDYDFARTMGEFDGYFMFDEGKDKPGGRREVSSDDEFRGTVDWKHRHYLDDNWELSLEFGYVSDETFLEEFFRQEAYGEKEYETSIYLKKQEEDAAFTFLSVYHPFDHMPQVSQLQTPGYKVEKYPEIQYYQIGTPLLNDKLTWYSENRAGLMAQVLPRVSPRRLGFNQAESIALFGIMAGNSFASDLSGAGYDDSTLTRGDTRQEIQMPLRSGPINVVPYVVGRVTAYDDHFADFSGNDENTRLWGGGGVRFSTAFSNVYRDVDSLLFDLHEIRHTMEPMVDLFYASSNVSQEDLPVYDYDVESLADGGTTRVGLRQIFSTKRGGPGMWRSVDFLRVDTDFVKQHDDDFASPIPEYFGYRPEYSLVGDHLWSEIAWAATDALQVVANTTAPYDPGQVLQWNAGLVYDHTPRFSSFVQARSIDILDSTILRYGVEYLFTPKYHVALSHAFDFEHQGTRSIAMTVTRRLPRWLLIVGANYDPIGDITSIGVAIAPEGFGGRGSVDNNPFTAGF